MTRDASGNVLFINQPNKRLSSNPGSDGMTIDPEGNPYPAGIGVFAFTPSD